MEQENLQGTAIQGSPRKQPLKQCCRW